MPYVSVIVAYGAMLATAGLLVAGALIIFMVILRDDGPEIRGERDSSLLGWPIGRPAGPKREGDTPGQAR